MEITQLLLTPNKYSRPKIPLEKVKGIVIHYVGNPGSSALGNRNYFENLKNQTFGSPIYASSHYIIGLEGEIIQCIPENEWAYCSNSRNKDTISIECCHPDITGKFNKATYNALVELCRDIIKRYNIDEVIRHYDITGKLCPKYYVNNPAAWEMLKHKILYNDKEGNNVKRYNTIEEIPSYYQQAIEYLINKGYLKGTETGLNLSEDMIRLLVINYRAGLYK